LERVRERLTIKPRGHTSEERVLATSEIIIGREKNGESTLTSELTSEVNMNEMTRRTTCTMTTSEREHHTLDALTERERRIERVLGPNKRLMEGVCMRTDLIDSHDWVERLEACRRLDATHAQGQTHPAQYTTAPTHCTATVAQR
jgi:hypothetical protein